MEPIKTEIVVVGAGPGGYSAAFYAADMGKRVLLVERDQRLGGVCLNRGCIPSKALLHATHVIDEAALSEARGVAFGKPKVKLEKLRQWKGAVIEKLAKGLDGLCSRRGVQRLHGRGHFEDSIPCGWRPPRDNSSSTTTRPSSRWGPSRPCRRLSIWAPARHDLHRGA